MRTKTGMRLNPVEMHPSPLGTQPLGTADASLRSVGGPKAARDLEACSRVWPPQHRLRHHFHCTLARHLSPESAGVQVCTSGQTLSLPHTTWGCARTWSEYISQTNTQLQRHLDSASAENCSMLLQAAPLDPLSSPLSSTGRRVWDSASARCSPSDSDSVEIHILQRQRIQNPRIVGIEPAPLFLSRAQPPHPGSRVRVELTHLHPSLATSVSNPRGFKFARP